MNKAYRHQKQFAIQGFMMRVLPCTSQIISIKMHPLSTMTTAPDCHPP